MIRSTSGLAKIIASAFWVKKFVFSNDASFSNSNWIKYSPLSDAGKKSEPIYPIPTKLHEPTNNRTERPKVANLVALLFKHHSRIPVIQCVNLVSPASKPTIMRPKKDFALICSNLPKREYNQGTTVKETNNDSKVEIITVTQNCARIFATRPVDIAIGKNTTTITNVIADTVNPISFAPS